MLSIWDIVNRWNGKQTKYGSEQMKCYNGYGEMLHVSWMATAQGSHHIVRF